MRSPSIVVVEVLIDRSLQALVAKNQSVVQAFISDAPHPAFCDRIGFWRFDRRTDLLDAQGLDAPVKYGTETAVTVVDQKLWRLC